VRQDLAGGALLLGAPSDAPAVGCRVAANSSRFAPAAAALRWSYQPLTVDQPDQVFWLIT
jgi:hypothetical protein